MAEKNLNTRIVLKNDTTVNWNKATNFIPKLGEIIIYNDVDRLKIGDGSTTIINLPFIDPEFTNAEIDALWNTAI